MKSGILYGMCWEDPDIFTNLVNENDRVLTVCSAGDIALSVLIKNPAQVIAVDTNSDQIQLT
ncbi:BtaA family protein, partial [Salibacteraceae bacterium]|nr:BtaA family protein [Salibacteraceae bacterium]